MLLYLKRVVFDFVFWVFSFLLGEQRDELREKLAHAKTYSEYRRIGQQIDERDFAAFKDSTSDCTGVCDHVLIAQRTSKLEELCSRGDPHALAMALRTELRRNLGAMSSPELYAKCVIGTKHFITRYIAAVTASIRYLANTSFASFDLEAKEIALRNTRQAFGGSALLLSGGASLGMYHFGVVRLLHEEKLLPKVICGSSIGSFVSALVAVRNDAELSQLLQDIEDCSINFGSPL